LNRKYPFGFVLWLLSFPAYADQMGDVSGESLMAFFCYALGYLLSAIIAVILILAGRRSNRTRYFIVVIGCVLSYLALLILTILPGSPFESLSGVELTSLFYIALAINFFAPLIYYAREQRN
jgi:hypothetical protein